MEHFLLEGEELVSYNYLIICHNIMLSLIKRANRSDWNSTTIKIKKKDINDWEKYDVEYWRLNGYRKEINKMYYQHMFFSIWADFLDYTYEANMAASKVKASIAYSLLRKPLKDNLYFLEVLENNGIQFMDDFLERPIEEFSIDKIDSEEKRKVIYNTAKEVFSEAYGEVLYNMRYAKKEDIGLEKIWNKTQHIITNCKHYRTEDGNLNMIFNDDKNIREFITYFYHVMPMIYTYTLKLTLKILQKLGLINEIEYIINNAITTNRYLMFSNHEKNMDLDKLLNETLLICPRCYKEINNNNKNKNILEMWYLNCPHCKKRINLDRFLFYNCHKEGNEYKKGRYEKK